MLLAQHQQLVSRGKDLLDAAEKALRGEYMGLPVAVAEQKVNADG